MLSGTREERSTSARRVWYKRTDETTTITALGEGKHYKFLGVLENFLRDKLVVLA